jgi:serine/threonine-protein kinase RsbW
VIAVSSPPAWRKSNTLSFSSTLYLLPILDLLLEEIPPRWKHEVRLGLQEALVNAAKHGNNLDPRKTVWVRFYIADDQYWWVISDEGNGFEVPTCEASADHVSLCERQECGRGLFILHQIFDKVQWNHRGTELKLCKCVESATRQPLVS